MNSPDNLQTTLMEFRHPETNAAVHLVGMIHFAQEDYYRRIQSELDGRQDDGHTIHYEQVKKRSEDSGLLLERKIQLLRQANGSAFTMFDGLGLVKQQDAITIHDAWENHDISLEDYADKSSFRKLVMRRAGAAVISRMAAFIPIDERVDLLIGILEKVEEQVLERRTTHRLNPEGVSIVKQSAGLEGDALTLDFRNDIALNAVDDRLVLDPEAHITLMWGEAHLLGQKNGLLERGFTQTDESRITAIEYEKIREFAQYAA